MKFPAASPIFRSHSHFDAFSLVEVALALGIFAFGMIGIMGLLPIGLTSLRESKARTIEATILQQRSSEVLQTPFEVLSTPGTPQYNLVTGLQFYSNEGIPIGNPRPSLIGAENLNPSSYTEGAIFASLINIYPSIDIANNSSTNIMRAVVEITRLSTPGKALKTPIYVPNLGK